MEPINNHSELKIFLVDDDVFNLKFTKFHLNRLGYKDVTIFNNGSDCITQITLNPDVVFLDQYMDGLQGIDVLKKIQQINPQIIVVMLSAEDSELSAIFFKQHGAFEYIIKGNDAMIRIEDILKKVSIGLKQ